MTSSCVEPSTSAKAILQGWPKKFEKISNFSPFRHFTSIYLRNNYKYRHISSVRKKVYPSPIQLSHVYGPIAHGVLQGGPKIE